MTKFTLGCDPELFIVDAEGKPVSAHGLIPGTKKEPHPVPAGAIQVDGIAGEFNTNPVDSGNFEEFNANIVRVLQELSKAVKKGNPDARFQITPTMHFDQAFLDGLPDEAKELGCDPDYNAYTLEPNPRPDGDRLFRTGSGHIHVGWGAGIPVDNEEHIRICADFVKMLDFTTGFFMTFIDRNPERRELYGKAGAFRPKPYGVEYRTPSNVWIRSKMFRKLMFASINKAIIYMRSGKNPGMFISDPSRIQSIINEGDWKMASEYLSAYTFRDSDNWFAIHNYSVEQLEALK